VESCARRGCGSAGGCTEPAAAGQRGASWRRPTATASERRRRASAMRAPRCRAGCTPRVGARVPASGRGGGAAGVGGGGGGRGSARHPERVGVVDRHRPRPRAAAAHLPRLQLRPSQPRCPQGLRRLERGRRRRQRRPQLALQPLPLPLTQRAAPQPPAPPRGRRLPLAPRIQRRHGARQVPEAAVQLGPRRRPRGGRRRAGHVHVDDDAGRGAGRRVRGRRGRRRRGAGRGPERAERRGGARRLHGPPQQAELGGRGARPGAHRGDPAGVARGGGGRGRGRGARRRRRL
ncbi:Protein of unknown function, partial [Gryllus bimaculatus]